MHWPRTVDRASLPLDAAIGRTIARVGRHGKFILIALDGGRTLAVHLRMTGRLLVAGRGERDAHERLTVGFDDGSTLRFADARKFGRVRLLDGDPKAELGAGIDALDPALDAVAFAALLARRKTPIKTLLLDQRRIAGIGNIYANEALFRARIRPRRRAGSLTAAERARLLRSLRFVLERAIERRGTSVADYVDAEGLPGEFQNLLAVYGRAGLPCRRCRTPIKRIELTQRGTFYCPVCQQ